VKNSGISWRIVIPNFQETNLLHSDFYQQTKLLSLLHPCTFAAFKKLQYKKFINEKNYLYSIGNQRNIMSVPKFCNRWT
jgi:hypothetical protein